MAIAPELADWLLDSDPTLRWQVERDLLHLPEDTWRATRARVPAEGFGRRLLERQDPEGTWARGAHFPGKGWRAAGVAIGETGEDAQPWVSTDWSLRALQDWGVDAAALGDTAERIAANCRWEYDGLPYWGGETDVCINAMTLASGAWLGADVAALAAWFPEHQLSDGGWNCEWVEGSRRSSFHSTLNALRGLLDYERITGDASVRAARRRGEEYLLARRLLYRLSSGEQVARWATRFSHPFRWRYSALSAADHFRAAGRHDGTDPDPRLADAMDAIRAAREPDGRWRQGGREPGLVWFETDVPPDEPSKWLTLVGTRVLEWWDGTGAERT
ncbi:squalene cyclase [Microbacterium rhizophilus]|uniref:squalene cyclase n=1 Tax=Microbacterium rhizophilus TaxID=3138934 RepID=UPI0031ED63DB